MICRIFWRGTQILNCTPKKKRIQATIKRRRLQWLGHILRISHNRIPRVALRWTAQEKRKQGSSKGFRLKPPWRRTFEKDIKAMGLMWGKAEMAALDRIGGRPHAPFGVKIKKKKTSKR